MGEGHAAGMREAAGRAPSISVVIKALNEERHVARAIESALAAIAESGRPGEVILADSGSADRTVEIALGYPVRVARLAPGEARSCGLGPQLGYQYATGDLVCLIDGDMALDPRFLAEACAFLAAHPGVAGVGGLVREANVVNLEFTRRERRGARDLEPGPVDRLNGGGLFRREAIEAAGHFSDRNLHGYEEFDLAARLRRRGWTLHRLGVPFVDHHGHTIGGYRLLWRRLRSRYVYGIGEALRAALGSHLGTMLGDLPELRLWLGVYAGWLAALLAAWTAPTPLLAVLLPLALVALAVAGMSLRYRSVPLGLYAVAAWNVHALGLGLGFLRPRVPPGRWIESDLVEGRGAALAAPPAGQGRAVAAILLAFALLAGAAPEPARAEWVAVRDTSLVIAPGSALDFSGLGSGEPAGAGGRVVAGADGALAFERETGARARLHCASLAWSPASGSYPDHAAADLYARQLRVHGYNIARLHFTDANLMTGRTRDFDYDPVQLDRFRYLLAALKREGIYWILDAMTSQNGALGDAGPDRWVDRHALKLDVHIAEEARRHWRRLAETLLAGVNPHTGLAPLHDPALALVVLVNENGAEFASILEELRTRRPYPASLKPHFNRWLARAYPESGALRAAWPDLGPDESAEAGTVRLPSRRAQRGPRMRDLQLFFRDLEADTFGWMSAELRALGYPGLVTAYNNMATTQSSLTRAGLPVVSIDTYHDEVLSFAPGTTIAQTSSLEDGLGYLRHVMGLRWLGRPFVVTEYDHLFWNRHRREAGLAVPAYAALQGWDAICRHAPGAIDLTFDQPWPHKRAILPYGLGLDPVGRAGETLAALLFRRGDVAPARGTVAVPFGRPDDLLEDGQGGLPDDLTRLGLVTRLGLAPRDAPAPRGAVTMPVEARGGALRRLIAQAASGPTRLDRLRAAGLLGEADRTDAGAGRYASDTGEITLDERARRLTLVTARTEAASLARLDAPLTLGRVTVEAASGPALVAVSALDGAGIGAARRLLVIVATDAMNTDMTFHDGGRRTIESFGRMPVLVERARLRVRLRLDRPAAWRLTSLRLDGSPGDPLPLEAGGEDVTATLDNAGPSHGPTTFFLLERGG